MAKISYSEWREKVKVREAKDGKAFPHVPKQTYYDRDKKLAEAGFLEWERFWLVAHKTATPGMKEMIEARQAKFQKAKTDKMMIADYRSMISKEYKRNGWTFNDDRLNPFKMLEHYLTQIGNPKDKWPYGKQAPKVKKDFVEAREKRKTKETERPSGSLLFRPPTLPF